MIVFLLCDGVKRYVLVCGFYCTLSPGVCLEKCEKMYSQLEKHKNMNKNLLSFLDDAKLACVKDNKAPIA